jgi:hypothetical protein
MIRFSDKITLDGFGGVAMSETKKQKVEHPAQEFARPADVVHDSELSPEEKKKALDTWEQDARQLVTASNEGMPGDAAGPERDENHKLQEVVNAKAKIGAKPRHKPAQ